MKLEFSQWIFEKFSNIKFLENPTSGSRVVPCGQTGRQTGGQKDMTKLTVAFRNFMNAPKNGVRNSGEGIDVNILYVAS